MRLPNSVRRLCGTDLISDKTNPQPNPPSELHALIASHQWDDAIQRCQTHPKEVKIRDGGYTALLNLVYRTETLHPGKVRSTLDDERGYTVLHSLLAYNDNTTEQDNLFRLVSAILTAAESVGFGAKFPSSITSRKTSGGSLRLLLDQKNHVRVSPLQLICDRGQLPLFRVLLQEHLLHSTSLHVLALPDYQGRNVLHYLFSRPVSFDFDTLRAVHYFVKQGYSLLIEKDERGRTPLDIVCNQYFTANGTRDEDEMYQNKIATYRLLQVLTWYLEQAEESAGIIDANDEDLHILGHNLFHAVCRLPMGSCPKRMFSFLYDCTSEPDFHSPACAVDENGNTALHLLLDNPSYKGEVEVFLFVLASNKDAVFVRNKTGQLPLHIAMDVGWRAEVLGTLIMLNAQAVLLYKRLETFVHAVGAIASCDVALKPDSEPKIVDVVVHPLDTVFTLIRARPDIIKSGGSEAAVLDK